MAFQIKAFYDIAASMMNHMRGTQSKITDFSVGSAARTLIEAPAIEIDELYQQMLNGLIEAIPVSTYRTFGFTALTAEKAYGVIRLTMSSSAHDIEIAEGVVWEANSGAIFRTMNAMVIPAGTSHSEIRVVSDVAGALGNVPSGTTWTCSLSLPAGYRAVNASDFYGGTEIETPDEMAIRFSQYMQTLQRGTLMALEFGLKSVELRNNISGETVERIRYSRIEEPYLLGYSCQAGIVNIYIHNGTELTSDALIAEADRVISGGYDADGNLIPGWKAAGVQVHIFRATDQRVDVSLNITHAGQALDIVHAAQTLIGGYISTLNVGQSVLVAKIIDLVMGISTVSNCYLTYPTMDVAVNRHSKAITGELSVSA